VQRIVNALASEQLLLIGGPARGGCGWVPL